MNLTCKNCNAKLNGTYCSNCGQKVYDETDKSLSNLIHEAFQFMTSFDGKIFNTVKTIYRFPGKISMDYANGIRQRYYKPFSFYLWVVILYLLFPMASGMNMEMKYYKATPFFGNYISQQIELKSLEKNITLESLAESFNQKSKSTSKVLLLLLIPMSLPLLYLLYFKRKRYLFDNFIVLTEINTFFLLTFFILIPLLAIPFFYFFNFYFYESTFITLIMILFVTYCIVLFHRVFHEKWWISVIKGSTFSLLFMLMIVVLYRPIVFMTTFLLL